MRHLEGELLVTLVAEAGDLGLVVTYLHLGAPSQAIPAEHVVLSDNI